MKRFALASSIVALSFTLGGCNMMSKDNAKTDPSASPSAAVSAAPSAAPSASVAAMTGGNGKPGVVAPTTPPANVPGVVADPNAPPSTDSADKTAQAEISKANYKSELDKLEKEDLSQDTK